MAVKQSTLHRIIKYVWIAVVMLMLFGGVAVGGPHHAQEPLRFAYRWSVSMIYLMLIIGCQRGPWPFLFVCLSLLMTICYLGCGHALQQLEQSGLVKVHGAHPVDGACLQPFVMSMHAVTWLLILPS
jgi:hypothetical protein